MQERGRVDYIQQDEEDFKVSATRHLVYAAHNRLTDAATELFTELDELKEQLIGIRWSRSTNRTRGTARWPPQRRSEGRAVASRHEVEADIRALQPSAGRPLRQTAEVAVVDALSEPLLD